MIDERGLDAAAEEQVRRLLAAARHDGPAPDEVVARIDAALRAEGRPGTTAADELASRRRRRRWTGGLAAAALVVVAGVGAGATGLLDGAGSGSESGSDASGSAPAAGDAGPDEGGTRDEAPERLGESAPADGLPRVRMGPTFTSDVRAALDGARRELGVFSEGASCAPPGAAGRVVRVRYDGAAADLVARRTPDGAREIALWACGPTPAAERTPERTLLLPAG